MEEKNFKFFLDCFAEAMAREEFTAQKNQQNCKKRGKNAMNVTSVFKMCCQKRIGN